MTCFLLTVGSGLLGIVAGSWVTWRVNERLFNRLQARRATLELIRELENRRVATESDREHLVRARAGAPARVNDGMTTKPGTLARYLRDTAAANKFAPKRG
ncbi:hypothetical protein PBI_ROPE_67 [Mycobacterium phage Rope]|uniref:Uncharacterized protein n=3 Tax=Papyrusvirus TaxID=1982554 RepID=A0A4D6TF42_9CAUD|nr:hypothetical protein N842_gp067 [Mycobacterium phage Papyrus]AGT14077.1 hypothetical protein PAPYRUS_67 [Mycobacterium phage Papyrus]QCG78172.1 hypothetical protein SEA_CANDLE_65 [Mycobacterium phage Candle]QNN99726.1 hypothetical protein PBI_ROPE_67 [Mycobacterium phage Rope]